MHPVPPAPSVAPACAVSVDDLLLVYITCADSGEATRLCTALVHERLAACANICDGVHSLYWWQGELQSASELVCVVKTTRCRFAELAARVRELHSYTTPCIVALPLAAADPEYAAWVRRETTNTSKKEPL